MSKENNSYGGVFSVIAVAVALAALIIGAVLPQAEDITISGLGDIHIDNPVNGAMLIYNASLGVWQNGPTQGSGEAVNCVNGSWIKHDLGKVPTAVTLTIKSGYINSTSSYVTPTVIASNSSHFQIGFYLREQPIDRLSMLVASTAGWDVAPSNIGYCTDDNWDTVTGIGSTASSGVVGNLTWDMGASYPVELRSKSGLWSQVDSMALKWYWSVDNVTYYPSTELSSSQIASTSEVVAFSQVEFVVARYVRLTVNHLTGGFECYAKFYECQAWDLTNAVLPVGVGNAASVFWTAIG